MVVALFPESVNVRDSHITLLGREADGGLIQLVEVADVEACVGLSKVARFTYAEADKLSE